MDTVVAIWVVGQFFYKLQTVPNFDCVCRHPWHARCYYGCSKGFKTNTIGGNMKRFIIAILFTALIPAVAFAVDKPTPAQAKKVLDYYKSGKGSGAVLVEFVLCSQIGADDADKNECSQLLDGGDILLNQDVYIWMNFMIPTDDTADIYLSYTRNGRIRKTQDITLKSAFRYRTWKKIATDKPGEWTIKIFQELDGKDIDLGSLTYVVKEE